MCLWKVRLKSIAINTRLSRLLAGPSLIQKYKEGPATQFLHKFSHPKFLGTASVLIKFKKNP